MGSAVEALRKEAGITQEELSSRIGRDSPVVGDIERGTANPTYESLLGLAQGLEVELSAMMKRAEELCAAARE